MLLTFVCLVASHLPLAGSGSSRSSEPAESRFVRGLLDWGLVDLAAARLEAVLRARCDARVRHRMAHWLPRVLLARARRCTGRPRVQLATRAAYLLRFLPAGTAEERVEWLDARALGLLELGMVTAGTAAGAKQPRRADRIRRAARCFERGISACDDALRSIQVRQGLGARAERRRESELVVRKGILLREWCRLDPRRFAKQGERAVEQVEREALSCDADVRWSIMVLLELSVCELVIGETDSAVDALCGAIEITADCFGESSPATRWDLFDVMERSVELLRSASVPASLDARVRRAQLDYRRVCRRIGID